MFFINFDFFDFTLFIRRLNHITSRMRGIKEMFKYNVFYLLIRVAMRLYENVEMCLLSFKKGLSRQRRFIET